MPATDAASTVSAQVAKRWRAIDPLLPAPAAPPGCGADLTVNGAGGPPSAVGTCEHWAGEPGTLDRQRFATCALTVLAASVAGIPVLTVMPLPAP